MNLDDFERHLFLTQPYGSPMREALERSVEEAVEEAKIEAYEEGKLDAPEVRELSEELELVKQQNSALRLELTAYRQLKYQLNSLQRRKLKKDELLAAIKAVCDSI